MATLIKLRRNFTAAAVPATLTEGELAVNPTDRKLFVGPSGGGTPIDLMPAATQSLAGRVEHATDAEIRAATSGNFAITANALQTAAVQVALTDAAPVAVNWTAGINFTLTVTASRQIGNPTNGIPGQSRTIMVQGNDGTDRTITFGNQFLGEVPTITDCDSGRWYLLSIYCHSTTHFVVSAKRANG